MPVIVTDTKCHKKKDKRGHARDALAGSPRNAPATKDVRVSGVRARERAGERASDAPAHCPLRAAAAVKLFDTSR